MIGPLAQSVEHLTLNQGVEGSSPSRLIFEATRFLCGFIIKDTGREPKGCGETVPTPSG